VNAEQAPVVAVASGKGGVGKTTVAVNVALALGEPVMITRAVPQQVAAYQRVAAVVRGALLGGTGAGETTA
jgi:MinD-like ATPase involved in chromosome partitioning or flagellar assembly